jgi:hypothetical protein
MTDHLWRERFGSLCSNGVLAYAASLVVAWLLGLAAHRLWFSPLAHIPGPRLAAVTGLFEFYYDCILGGRYIFEIEKMHQQYGWSFLFP